MSGEVLRSGLDRGAGRTHPNQERAPGSRIQRAFRASNVFPLKRAVLPGSSIERGESRARREGRRGAGPSERRDARPSPVARCGVIALETYVNGRLDVTVVSLRERLSYGAARARSRGLALALSLGTLLLGGGCDEPRASRAPAPRRAEPEERSAPGPAGYRVVDVEEPGSLAGNVRWVGPVPAVEAIPVLARTEVCGSSQPSLALRVSPRGGVADTVVWLADIRAGLAAEPPPQVPTISVHGCRYVPHVLGVAIGWTLQFRNQDPTLQNVRAFHRGTTLWDFGLPERDASETREVRVLGPIHVVSDVHAWMHAWVHAFPHPYFAVTGPEGRFRIPGVPPGQYVLRVWHEGWRIVGTRSGRPQYSSPVVLARTVSVISQQETTIDFELSRELGELAGEE